MSFFIGYTKPNSKAGQTLSLDDCFYGIVSDGDAISIANHLRKENGSEPSWQKVRGQLIQLAKSRLTAKK